MFKKTSLILPLFFILSSCSSAKKIKAEGPSAKDLPNTEEIIIQDSTSSATTETEVVKEAPAETQNMVRTASVWIDAIGTDAFMAIGFMQELEKHVDIQSVNGVGFGCWAAISWASENRGTYAEWQSFKWDSWDLLGANLLNRVIGRSTTESFKSRLEKRLPAKAKDNFKIPMACPYVYAKRSDFNNPRDLATHEELWIQMRNTFFFPLADIEKDQRKSGFFRGPVQPQEFVKWTPSNLKAEEHVWIVLSSEPVRKELRRGPQPELQRGIIDNVRWIKKILAPRDVTTVTEVKDLKKKRSMLLKGRKEGKQFFENPAVTTFMGFGNALQ